VGSQELREDNIAPAGRLKVWFHGLYAKNEVHVLRLINRLLSNRFLNRGKKRILRGLRAILSFLPTSEVVSHERALAFIDYLDRFGDPKIAIGPCRCEESLHPGRKGRMREMVILFGADAYRKVLEGYQTVSTSEAKYLLRHFRDEGLVHAFFACMGSQQWLFAICHCGADACIPLRTQKTIGGVFFPGPDIVVYEAAKCRNCGSCVSRCQFGAISRNGNVRYDPTTCMGCGICVSSCPEGALSLVERENYRSRYYPLELVSGFPKKP
jgi:ferredoxin